MTFWAGFPYTSLKGYLFDHGREQIKPCHLLITVIFGFIFDSRCRASVLSDTEIGIEAVFMNMSVLH